MKHKQKYVYDNDGKKITNPATLRAIKEADEIYVAWKSHLSEHKNKISISDIHIYDEDGQKITNPETLEAIAESQEILETWLRRKNNN